MLCEGGNEIGESDGMLGVRRCIKYYCAAVFIVTWLYRINKKRKASHCVIAEKWL